MNSNRVLGRIVLALALALALALSAPALAAKKPKGKTKGKQKEKAAAHERSTASKAKQDLKFSGLKLKGDLKKPDLSYIYKRRGVKNEQIVNIPTDFDDEIRQGENQF